LKLDSEIARLLALKEQKLGVKDLFQEFKGQANPFTQAPSTV